MADTTMGEEKGPTERLATFLAEGCSTDFAPELLDKSATSLVDSLGLALAARGEKTVAAYSSLSDSIGSGGTCRLWGRPGATSVLDAVTGNALATHARFQDDCDMTSWAHPASLIVPVAVGLGEHLGSSVADVLRAILCGYTTLNWLGADEVVGRAIVERGFRASPTLGSIAAAATGSVLLGLPAAAAGSAVAIAVDSTGGLLEPVRAGASDWRVQNATAAYRGTLAALLAERGVDGPPMALEGPAGFLRAFAGLTEVPPALHRDPDPCSILTVWAKPFPTLGDNMAVVSAALALRDQVGDPGLISKVTVHQNAHFASYPGTSFRGPFTRPSQAMASTAFATAATLLYGAIQYRLYETGLDDPAITALIDHIRVVPEPAYGYLDATVEVETTGGRTVTRSAAELPRGLFFRDRESATEAFFALLDEANYPQDFARRVPSLVLDPTERARTPIRTVVDAVTDLPAVH